MKVFIISALNYLSVPAGAVTVVRASMAVSTVVAVMIAPTVAMTITSTVSLAVPSTRASIRRNLACLELEINPLVAHFCLQVADLSL